MRVPSKKTIVSALGIFAGLGGASHGPGEILQGSIAPSDLIIKAWPSLTALNGEPAMTIIPNFIVAGILTIVVGLLVAVWAAKYIDGKNGGLVLILLSVMMLLVGEGLIPPLIGIGAGILAIRIKNHSESTKPVRCCFMPKALIVYGSRYGATASTSEEIAEVLRREAFDVRVVNAKQEGVQDISDFDLIVVGSGMQIDRWTGEAEGFLKKFHSELTRKKAALFVSSGAQAIIEHEGDPDLIKRAKKKYLEEKAAEYSLQPIALGLFGGIWDYNKMLLWVKVLPAAKNNMEANKQKLKAAGFGETKPGIYDTRDWEAIRNWSKVVAEKARA